MPGRSLADFALEHSEELFRFLFQQTGSSTLSEDLLQEVWIKASQSKSELPSNPRAYLFRLARNLVIDNHRRQSVRGQTDGQAVAIAPNGELEETDGPALVCDKPLPDAVAAAREEFAILFDALGELPDLQREVFLLYRVRGMKMREVAEAKGMTVKAAEHLVAQALVHCRLKLQRD